MRINVAVLDYYKSLLSFAKRFDVGVVALITKLVIKLAEGGNCPPLVTVHIRIVGTEPSGAPSGRRQHCLVRKSFPLWQ